MKSDLVGKNELIVTKDSMVQRGFKDLKGYYVLAVLGRDNGAEINLIWKFKEKNQNVQAKPGKEFVIMSQINIPSRIHLDAYVSDYLDLIVYGSRGKSVIYVKKITEKDRVPGKELESWPNDKNYDQKFNLDVE